MTPGQYVLARNLSRDSQQPIRARVCASFFSRMRGLTFRRTLSAGEGILLVQARDSRLDAAIHMLGVLMDLTIVWVNSNGEVVDVRLARRWRPVYIPSRPARYVLESSAECFADFRIGDQIRFEEVDAAD